MPKKYHGGKYHIINQKKREKQAKDKKNELIKLRKNNEELRRKIKEFETNETNVWWSSLSQNSRNFFIKEIYDSGNNSFGN